MVGIWSRRIYPDGWVYDYSAGKWYYVDENTGMLDGRYLDPQDGRWYYLDPVTGEMLTEWQLIPDLGYVYLIRMHRSRPGRMMKH